MTELIPIFICAVMPIAIVAIVMLKKFLSEKSRTDIAMKAIEAGHPEIVPKVLNERSQQRLTRTTAQTYLRNGLILLAIGLSITVYLALDDGLHDIFLLPAILCLFIGTAYIILTIVASRHDRADKTEDDA